MLGGVTQVSDSPPSVYTPILMCGVHDYLEFESYGVPEGGDAGVDGALSGSSNRIGEQCSTVPVHLGRCWTGGHSWICPKWDGNVVLGAVVLLCVTRPGYRSADPEAGGADGRVVDFAHVALGPDADLVVLVGKVVAAVIVEGFEVASGASEVLGAVRWSSIPGSF